MATEAGEFTVLALTAAPATGPWPAVVVGNLGAGATVSSLACVDVDGDGFLDVVVAWSGGVSWLANLPGGGVQPPALLLSTADAGIVVTSATVARVGSSRALTLVVGSTSEHTVQACGLGDTLTPALPLTELVPVAGSLVSVSAQDVQGDGLVDVVVLAAECVWISVTVDADGLTGFTVHPIVAAVGLLSPEALAWGDFDNDGDLGMRSVWMREAGGHVRRVFHGRGGGEEGGGCGGVRRWGAVGDPEGWLWLWWWWCVCVRVCACACVCGGGGGRGGGVVVVGIDG